MGIDENGGEVEERTGPGAGRRMVWTKSKFGRRLYVIQPTRWRLLISVGLARRNLNAISTIVLILIHICNDYIFYRKLTEW